MKYLVVVCDGMFESDSRDSKRHLRNNGGDRCVVKTKGGKVVSSAIRWADGKITNVEF